MAFYNGCVYGNGPEVTEVWHDECFIPVFGPLFDSNSGQQPDPWRWAPTWAAWDTATLTPLDICPACRRPVIGQA